MYSGAKAGTVSYVQQVGELKEKWPGIIGGIVDTMLDIVEAGRTSLEARNWSALGQLMDMQHGLLHALGVDTPSLAEIVFAARQAGALGAKLSGAGGGDCAIVLVDDAHRKDVIAAMREKQVVNFGVNATGVCLET